MRSLMADHDEDDDAMYDASSQKKSLLQRDPSMDAYMEDSTKGLSAALGHAGMRSSLRMMPCMTLRRRRSHFC